jgi:hypothetical protein
MAFAWLQSLLQWTRVHLQLIASRMQTTDPKNPCDRTKEKESLHLP